MPESLNSASYFEFVGDRPLQGRSVFRGRHGGQALGIAISALTTDFVPFALGAVLPGLLTAMVCPALLAAIIDKRVCIPPIWSGFTSAP